MPRWPMLLLFAVVLSSCASHGREFPVDSIPRIRIGETTQAQVREIFGEPTGISVIGSGGSEWNYEFEQVETRGTRSVGKLGCWLSRIFGSSAGCLGSPVDVEYESRQRHQLVVYYDGRGVVQDYVYERDEEPSRRVY